MAGSVSYSRTVSEPIPQNLRQLLAATRLLTDSQLDTLLAAPRGAGESLVTALVKSGAVAEEKRLEEVARALQLSYTRITDKEIDTAARA